MGKLIGGRYEMGDVLGQGGMGTVYMGTDVRNGRRVAIKMLKPEVVANEPGLIERFRREGEALRRLNHPNIVRMLGLFSEETVDYIVMEYVSGGSLNDLIRQARKPLPLDTVLRIALELSDALARAHHLNIIHRDLKPANILLAKRMSPRLTDFGVAHLGDRSRVTQAQTVLGTLAYLSPEALNGDLLDIRTDIWSFGILLYEALTLQLPFIADTPAATIKAIYTNPLPDLKALRDDVPPQLIVLMENMLEKDVNKRIGSARRVGAELYAIIEGRPSMLGLAPPPSQMMPVELDSENAILLQHLILDLVALQEDWERQAGEAGTYGRQIKTNDLSMQAYYRGISKGLQTAANELYSLLDSENYTRNIVDGEPKSNDDQPVYVSVDQQQVEQLFKKIKLKPTNIYIDEGPVFSVVLSRLVTSMIDERIQQLQAVAPGLVILDSGLLADTGEPYIDFAFTTPIE